MENDTNLIVKLIKRFDFYKVTPDNIKTSTKEGSFATLIAFILIFIFVTKEIYYYCCPDVQSEMFVDDLVKYSDLEIKFNLTFPSIPCLILLVKYSNDFDKQHQILKQGITFTRLRNNGDEISPFVKDEEYQKNTNQMIDSINSMEGCRIVVNITKPRIPGGFYINIGGLTPEVYFRLTPDKLINMRVSHKINLFEFGKGINENDPYESAYSSNYYKKLSDLPLVQGGTESVNYYMNVIRTKVIGSNNQEFISDQFSYSLYHRPMNEMTLRFLYDISPIYVQYKNNQELLSHIVGKICAIFAGIFTVLEIVILLYSAFSESKKNYKEIQSKIDEK